MASVLSIAFSSDFSQSSVAVVLNKNGIVTDRRIIGRGGRVIRSDKSDVVETVRKMLIENEVHAVVMNTGLQVQTREMCKDFNNLIKEINVSD